jgi:hypothetical protein
MGLSEGDVLLCVRSFFRAVTSNAPGKVCTGISALQVSNCASQVLGSAADLLGEQATDVWLTVPAADVKLWWPAGYGVVRGSGQRGRLRWCHGLDVTYGRSQDGRVGEGDGTSETEW